MISMLMRIGTMEIALIGLVILGIIIATVVVTSKKSKNGRKAVGSDISAADELLKYKKLLDDGVITEQEYNAKKKQLM